MSRIRVIYRSGSEVEFNCDQFTIKKNAFGEPVEVSWENAKPDPMLFGLGDIAAIWQMK